MPPGPCTAPLLGRRFFLRRRCRPCTESIRNTEHPRSEEHTSELQSPCNLVCRLLLEKKNIQVLQVEHGILKPCLAEYALEELFKVKSSFGSAWHFDDQQGLMHTPSQLLSRVKLPHAAL